MGVKGIHVGDVGEPQLAANRNSGPIRNSEDFLGVFSEQVMGWFNQRGSKSKSYKHE